MIPIEVRNKLLRRKNELFVRKLLGSERATACAMSHWSLKRRADFSFNHGLGDCFNAATLFHSIQKITGQSICVECPPEFRPIFIGANVPVAMGATFPHPWDHPAYAGTIHPIWVDNKTAHNSPVPMTDEIWQSMIHTELRLKFSEEPRIRAWMDTLQRPITLLHTRGASSGVYKDFPQSLEDSFCREFRKSMPGTLVWVSDDPVPTQERIVSKVPTSVGQLYSLIALADLVIGIDSGPLHMARWTDTPAVGCWFSLHPTAFAIPSPRIKHLVSTEPQVPNQYGAHDRYAHALHSRKEPFNLVPVSRMTVDAIVTEALKML